MIRITTKLTDDVVLLNDNFFNTKTVNQVDANADAWIIQKIDSAEIVADGRIQTPYGVTSMMDLSTGCKTYLNVIHNKDLTFSIDECGGNVLTELFKLPEINVFQSRPDRFVITDDTAIEIDGTVVYGKLGYREWWSQKSERSLRNDLQ